MAMNPHEEGQYVRPSPEERRKKIKKIKRKRRFRLAVVTLAALLVLSVILSPVFMFAVFRVKSYSVTGETHYSKEEIIESCPVEVGKSLVLVDLEKAQAAIEEKLPYVKKATLKRSLPSTLSISVTQASEKYTIYSGKSGNYLILSETFKILGVSHEAKEGLTVIKGALPEETEAGKQLRFVKAEKKDEPAVNDKILSTLEEVAYALVASGIEDVTRIDITSVSDIKVLYQDRLILEIGSVSDADGKLELAAQVIEKEDELNPEQKGTIDLTISKKAYVNPGEFEYDSVEQEDEESEQTQQSSEENEEGDAGREYEKTEQADGESEEDSAEEEG